MATTTDGALHRSIRKQPHPATIIIAFHTGCVGELGRRLKQGLQKLGHFGQALETLGIKMDEKITTQSSVDLTPEARRALPRAAGGEASTKGFSPAMKAILSSQNERRTRVLGNEFDTEFGGEKRETVEVRVTSSDKKGKPNADSLGLDSSESEDSEKEGSKQSSDSDDDDDDKGELHTPARRPGPQLETSRTGSTKHQLENLQITQEAAATLASLSARFPQFVREIDKKANTEQRTSSSEFSPVLLIAAATATKLQVDGLDILRASAQAEASIGGKKGALLAEIIASDSKLDSRIARMVREEKVKYNAPTWEAMVGMTPILQFVLQLCKQYHSAPIIGPTDALLEAARALRLTTGSGRLDIQGGMEEFEDARDEANRRMATYPPSPIAAALAEAVSLAKSHIYLSDANDDHGALDWGAWARKVSSGHNKRIAEGGSRSNPVPPYTQQEYDRIVDDLATFSDAQLSDMQDTTSAAHARPSRLNKSFSRKATFSRKHLGKGSAYSDNEEQSELEESSDPETDSEDEQVSSTRQADDEEQRRQPRTKSKALGVSKRIEGSREQRQASEKGTNRSRDGDSRERSRGVSRTKRRTRQGRARSRSENSDEKPRRERKVDQDTGSEDDETPKNRNSDSKRVVKTASKSATVKQSVKESEKGRKDHDDDDDDDDDKRRESPRSAAKKGTEAESINKCWTAECSTPVRPQYNWCPGCKTVSPEIWECPECVEEGELKLQRLSKCTTPGCRGRKRNGNLISKDPKGYSKVKQWYVAKSVNEERDDSATEKKGGRKVKMYGFKRIPTEFNSAPTATSGWSTCPECRVIHVTGGQCFPKPQWHGEYTVPGMLGDTIQANNREPARCGASSAPITGPYRPYPRYRQEPNRSESADEPEAEIIWEDNQSQQQQEQEVIWEQQPQRSERRKQTQTEAEESSSDDAEPELCAPIDDPSTQSVTPSDDGDFEDDDIGTTIREKYWDYVIDTARQAGGKHDGVWDDSRMLAAKRAAGEAFGTSLHQALWRDTSGLAEVAAIMANALSPESKHEEPWYHLNLRTPPRGIPYRLRSWRDLVFAAYDATPKSKPWSEDQFIKARMAAQAHVRSEYQREEEMSASDVLLYATAAAQVASRMSGEAAERRLSPPTEARRIMKASPTPLLPMSALLGSEIEAPVCMMALTVLVVEGETNRILSTGMLQKLQWTVHLDGDEPENSYVSNGGQRYQIMLSEGNVPFLTMVHFVNNVFQLYDSGNPEHLVLPQIQFMLDSGAEAHVFGRTDSRLLHEVVEAPPETLTGLGDIKIKVTGTGTFFIAHIKRSARPRTRIDPKYPRGPGGGGGGSGRHDDGDDSAGDETQANKKRSRYLPPGRTVLAYRTEKTQTAKKGKNGKTRASAFPPISSATEASERYNLFTVQSLKAFKAAVRGTKDFTISDKEDYGTALLSLIGKTRPKARSTRNQLTKEIGDSYHKASVWNHDAGPQRPSGPDFEGNNAIRKFFNNYCGFCIRHGCTDMTTDTLLEQCDKVIQEVLRDFPGLAIFVFKSDMASEVAKQGKGDDANVAKITAFEVKYQRLKIGVRFITYAPRSQHLQKGENWTKSFAANVLANAVRAGLGEGALPALERSAVVQHNMQVPAQAVDAQLRNMTRKQALYGHVSDASTMLGYSCQAAFYPAADGKTNMLKVSAKPCLYVAPGTIMKCQIVLDLANMKFVTTSSVFLVKEKNYHSAAMLAGAMYDPKGTIMVQHPKGHYLKALASVLEPLQGPPQFAMVEVNPATGIPTRAVQMAPAIDENGHLIMEAVVEGEVEEGDANDGTDIQDADAVYTRLGDGTGQRLSAGDWNYFRMLPESTKVRTNVAAKEPRGGAIPSKSCIRMRIYGQARTIGELRALHPEAHLYNEDMKNDLHKGHILIQGGRAVCTAGRTITSPEPPRSPTTQAQKYVEAMESIEGPQLATTDNANEVSIIGPLPLDTPKRVRIIQRVKAALHQDYPDITEFEAYVPEAVVRQSTDAAGVPASLNESERHPKYPGEDGWYGANKKEIGRVSGFGAWTVVSTEHRNNAIKIYGPRKVTTGHIVFVYKEKKDLDGKTTLRTRVAVSDPHGKSAGAKQYTACLDAVTNRAHTYLSAYLGYKETTLDAYAAFFHGKRAMPERLDGKPQETQKGRADPAPHGREVYAHIHPSMQRYGNFPTHDSRGRKNLLHLPGNFPGLVEASFVFNEELNGFYDAEKFQRGVIDLCTFVRTEPTGTVSARFHVDDIRTAYNTDKALTKFEKAFSKRFAEDPSHTFDRADESFTGIRTKVISARAREITGLRALDSLAAKIQGRPLPSGVEAKYPLPVNAMRVLSEGPTEANPLTPNLLEEAQEILGSCGHVATIWRPDACFAFSALAAHTNEGNITQKVFNYILRVAHYLVESAPLPLVLTAPDKSAAPDKFFVTYGDSAHANGPDKRSYVGYAILALGEDGRTSGALAWSTKAPRFHADSTGCVELYGASIAYKGTLALRQQFRDWGRLGLPIEQQAPTPLYIDASVVVDGVATGRITKQTRWMASRFGMLANGRDSGQTELRKISGKKNCSDILTKPMVGPDFDRHRATILGLAGMSPATIATLDADLQSRVLPYI